MVIDQWCGGPHTPLAIDDPRAEDGIFQVELATDEHLRAWDVASARGVSPHDQGAPPAEYLAMRTRYSVAGLMDIPELVERAVARSPGASGAVVADWTSTECAGPGAWRLSPAARCQAGTGVLMTATQAPASIELPARRLVLPAWAEVVASIRIVGDRGGPGQASIRWKDRHGAWRADGTRAIALPRRAGAVDLHFFVAPRAHGGTIAQLALDLVSPDASVAIDRITARALP